MSWDEDDLELLGVDPSPAPPAASRPRGLAGRAAGVARRVPAAPAVLAAAAVGALAARSHPVLAALGAAGLVGNVRAAAAGEISWAAAAKKLGQHVVASAGSLALQSHPVLGYVAGAVAAELFVGERGEWDLDPLEAVPVEPAAPKALGGRGGAT